MKALTTYPVPSTPDSTGPSMLTRELLDQTPTPVLRVLEGYATLAWELALVRCNAQRAAEIHREIETLIEPASEDRRANEHASRQAARAQLPISIPDDEDEDWQAAFLYDPPTSECVVSVPCPHCKSAIDVHMTWQEAESSRGVRCATWEVVQYLYSCHCDLSAEDERGIDHDAQGLAWERQQAAKGA